MSRFEELLLCLLNGTKTQMVAQSRIEEVLIALINEQEPPSVFESELEKAFIDAFVDVNDAYMVGDTLYLVNVPANQIGEIVKVL